MVKYSNYLKYCRESAKAGFEPMPFQDWKRVQKKIKNYKKIAKKAN